MIIINGVPFNNIQSQQNEIIDVEYEDLSDELNKEDERKRIEGTTSANE